VHRKLIRPATSCGFRAFRPGTTASLAYPPPCEHALEVPGTGTLNNRDNGSITAISCAAPGKCTAVGYLTSGKTGYQTYLVTQS
jgi:hypothetical protein